MNAIEAFVDADSWDASRKVVEANRELLLGPEVEAIFEQNLAQARRAGDERAMAYLRRHLDLLRACRNDGIEAAFATVQQEQEVDLPFDPELIPQSVAALRGTPQDRLAHLQRIAPLLEQAEDTGLRALLSVIQAALVGGDLAELGRGLTGVYTQVWHTITVAVSGEDTGVAMLSTIASNTLAVLGPMPERRSEWRSTLVSLRNQATVQGDRPLIAFLDAVLGLLDAGGNPTGLGQGFAGVYAAVWLGIVNGLAAQQETGQ
jgi:hypothetical protein